MVDSILLALVRPLLVCIDLAASTVTATTRRLVATLACLVNTLDRCANWMTKLSGPALTALANALHRGYVGKKRRPLHHHHTKLAYNDAFNAKGFVCSSDGGLSLIKGIDKYRPNAYRIRDNRHFANEWED